MSVDTIDGPFVSGLKHAHSAEQRLFVASEELGERMDYEESHEWAHSRMVDN